MDAEDDVQSKEEAIFREASEEGDIEMQQSDNVEDYSSPKPGELSSATSRSNSNQASDQNQKRQRVGVFEVFQFGQGPKKWCGLSLGLTFAAISGCVYPIMAFVLSTTFRVLSVPTADQFMGDIRELAFIFMGIGAVAFVSVTAQINLLEVAAEEVKACVDMYIVHPGSS